MFTYHRILAWSLLVAVWASLVAPVTATARAQSDDYIRVTLKAGESLLTLTQTYGVSAWRIVAVNSFRDPNLLLVGDVVVIPVARSFTPSLTTPFYYTAQSGDTLESVARRFSYAPGVIARANGNLRSLTPGVTYLMPAGPRLYTIQSGQTLADIAALFNVPETFILSGNSGLNPGLIYAGQQIFIPVILDAAPVPVRGEAGTAPGTGFVLPPTPTVRPGVPTPRPAVTAAPVSPERVGQFIQEVARPGDSLRVYVNRYGVNAAAILRANPRWAANPNVLLVGAVVTIPVPISFTPSRTTPFYYTVGEGETAATIAAKFEMTADTLIRANPGAPALPGRVILVPAGPHVYTVKAGDVLADIAKRFGARLDDIVLANNLASPSAIYPGLQLRIPLVLDAPPLPY